MIGKVLETVPRGKLKADLEKYRMQAINMGATDAKIISARDVIVDERVRMKCIYPKCYYYGQSANCPPYSATPSEMRAVLKRFHYGILFTLQSPPDTVVGPYPDIRRQASQKMHEIASKLEGNAFYDGYYLALGFSGGSCKIIFCAEEECSAIKGKGCRARLKARGSMESVGMDAYRMAIKAGWDIYPCGISLRVDDVPFGRRVGLVLIY